MIEVTFYNVRQRAVHLKDSNLEIAEVVPLWVIKHWKYSHKHDLQSRLSYIMARVGRQGGLDWIYKEIRPYVYEYFDKTTAANIDKADIAFQPYLEFRSDLKERMMKWQATHSLQSETELPAY